MACKPCGDSKWISVRGPYVCGLCGYDYGRFLSQALVLQNRPYMPCGHNGRYLQQRFVRQPCNYCPPIRISHRISTGQVAQATRRITTSRRFRLKQLSTGNLQVTETTASPAQYAWLS